MEEAGRADHVFPPAVPGSKPPVYYQLQAYLTAGQVPETETVEGQLVVQQVRLQ